MLHNLLVFKRSIYLLLLACMVNSPVGAALVEDLYSVELPVADQTTTQRLEVFRQAMREVIVKVSGSSSALDAPGLKRPLISSARYVLQYRYFNRRDPQDENFDAGQLFLRVVFNQEALESLLRENNIPIWGKQRPGTLMLIMLDVNQEVALVSGDTTPEMLEELEQEAGRKGLPVLFPLLDLEDRAILGEGNTVALNEVEIEGLTERYVPEAVLVGRLSGKLGEGWRGEWQVRLADQVNNWSFRGKSREDTIRNLMDRLANILATQYALQSDVTVEQDILLGVERINQITDHTQVLAYLQSLNAVESARPVLIHEDRVTYRVSLRSSVEDLQQLIGLGMTLEQLDLPAVDTTLEDDTVLLNYQFVR
jgi:hypothetical protein